MRRVTRFIEVLAALLLGLVAVLTCIEVAMRSLFNINIPDAYTLAGYAQSIAVFWGIALAFAAGTHISVDLAWSAMPRPARRALDLLAEVVVAIALGALMWMMVDKVMKSHAAFDATQQLRLPTWPFAAVAALGAGLAFVFVLVRVWQRASGEEPAEGYGGGMDDTSPGSPENIDPNV